MTPDRISLRSGRVIGSPLERLVEFAELDGTYQGYDQISPDPFELNALDVRLANRIIARMGADVSARISNRSSEVANALRRVPTNATLVVPADHVDWDALHGLYRALSGLPAVGVPRMTKLLHRKRRPDGEARNEPCPEGHQPSRHLGASTLTAKGPVCELQPADQGEVTLRVGGFSPRVRFIFRSPSAGRRRRAALGVPWPGSVQLGSVPINPLPLSRLGPIPGNVNLIWPHCDHRKWPHL